jgi:hypothetical protein
MQERTTNHKDPHHTIFSSVMSLPFPQHPVHFLPSQYKYQVAPLPKQPATLKHCMLYSNFSNSSDNYNVGKTSSETKCHWYNATLSLSPSTPAYAESSFTTHSASRVLYLWRQKWRQHVSLKRRYPLQTTRCKQPRIPQCEHPIYNQKISWHLQANFVWHKSGRCFCSGW